MPSHSGKVLVVEDEPMVRSVCEKILSRHNLVPICCENGVQALSVYHEMHSEIALILSDIVMPFMDGPTLVRQIFEHNPKSNVILMTGYSVAQAAPEDLKRLCSTIRKPFSAAQLMEVVKKCLDYQLGTHPSEPSAMIDPLPDIAK